MTGPEAEVSLGHDLRMPLVGASAWLAGIAAAQSVRLAVLVLAGTGVVVAVAAVRHRRGPGTAPRWPAIAAACAVAATAVVLSIGLRGEAVTTSLVHGLAEERATVDLVAVVASDPRVVRSSRDGAPQVVVRLRVQELSARGHRARLGASVVLLGTTEWREAAWGETVLVEGRLAPADDAGVAALVVGARPPVRIRGPDPWWRAAAAVRASIRESVAHRPAAEATLVPALVVGDDAGLPRDVEEEFRDTGLTHLTAVSGTNLTLVVGALLLLARMLGVRGRWLLLVGLVGIAGFVLLARTEPSVLRAAAMGTVGLFAFGADGRRRGLRALGVAVTALVLVAPSLATSPGFALSVLATAGIVVLGPPLTAGLGRWLPAGVSQAVAIPTAAQLACTPVIAALSGEISLVAVLANLLAGPAVGPATVLGLVAGLVGLVWDGAASVVGTLAAWCVGWIVLVADRGAALPGAALGWGSGGLPVLLLSVLCVVAAIWLPRWASRPAVVALGVAVVLLVVVGVPGRVVRELDGWPPPDWVLVACDVGQGDALVLRVGPREGVVVDAGPDAAAVDECLDRLQVRTVVSVVLTHFHADHVAGLSGVLDGRQVGRIEVSPVADPPGGVADVEQAARSAGIPIRVARLGETWQSGGATIQVVHPAPTTRVRSDGSSANDGSVVLLVQVRGVRLLLTGDVEPAAQRVLAQRLIGLEVDVLKVPHHGSAHQQEDWLAGLEPQVAVVSVGADNDYGHPSADLLSALRDGGAEVVRTDEDGAVAVTVDTSGVLGVTSLR